MAEQQNGSNVERLVAELSAEADRMAEENRRSMILGAIAVLIVAVYLGWASMKVGQLLEPEGLALAATGAALEAVPEASQQLEQLLVDGAPDLARAASQMLVDAVPVYRQNLEAELAPVIDEVASIVAAAAVNEMVRAAKEGRELPQDMALQAAADAVVQRLDAMWQEALDAPSVDGGVAPREAIEAALGRLRSIDRELALIARGRGDPVEREFLLSWMGLVTQLEDQANAAAVETRKREPAAAP